jgi:hypothetical protein
MLDSEWRDGLIRFPQPFSFDFLFETRAEPSYTDSIPQTTKRNPDPKKRRAKAPRTKTRAEGSFMPKPKGENNVPAIVGFNYDLLETKVAEKVRSSADRIRERINKTVEDIIAVGNELLAVKDSLDHGQFGPWLKAEFGWSERSARNFMAVAEQFGKSANFADLPFQPSAAYLLAAPAVPDEARQKAVEKAEAGEEITFAAAKVIVREAKKKKRPRRRRAVPIDRLGVRLVNILERYKERWDPDEMAELARRLREFADGLDSKGKRKGKG